MKDYEVGKYWDGNAEAWTKMSRLGSDKWRDLVNAPAFQNLLPEIAGLTGLDVGCGEGYNTRLTAGRSVRMIAFDISKTFVRYAADEARTNKSDIKHAIASASAIPFKDEFFDFIMATMSLMDAPDHESIFTEIFRVLKPGGFLQFSIVHPCFAASESSWEFDSEGRKTGFICRGYFNPEAGEIEEWSFSHAPEELRKAYPKFQVARFNQTLSGWVNLIVNSGFVIEAMDEPHPEGNVRHLFPKYTDSGLIPFSLIIRCRK